MKKIGWFLLLGAGAGVLDATPMIMAHMNGYAIISAFVHWVVLGVIIPSVRWNVKSGLKGIVIAVLAALPVLVLVLEDEPMSVFPILAASVVLGAVVGILGNNITIKMAER